MYIAPVSSQNRFNYPKQTQVFRGQLEDEYFRAARSNQIGTQIQKISELEFDIRETDAETGDNFLHSALKTNNKALISRAIILLKQQTTRNNDLAKYLLEQKNYEQKRPIDYANNMAQQMLRNVFGELQISNQDRTEIIDETPNLIVPAVEETPVQEKIAQSQEVAPRRLNELPKGTKIAIPDLDDEDEDDYIPSEKNISTQSQSQQVEPLATKQNEVKDIAVKKKKNTTQKVDNNVIDNAEEKVKSKKLLPKTDIPDEYSDNKIVLSKVAGMTVPKQIIESKIIRPLKAGQTVRDSGFLFYGPTGCGKGFLLNVIANTLEKDVISDKKLFQMVETAVTKNENDTKQQDKVVEEILVSNIVRVEDVQQLESVMDFAAENFKKTGKQTIVYIDEIKGILPDVSAVNSNQVTKAEQLIENSSLKGVILIATTREKDSLSPDSIRGGRFDRKIELKFPNREERKEILNTYLMTKYSLSDEDMESILNKTSGFSYLNMRKAIELINDTDVENIEDQVNLLKSYARENNLGEINDAGTTVNYDTKIKRANITTDFSKVAGMNKVKRQFQTLLIERLKPEALKRFKENGNRIPLRAGFLLYGPPGTGKTYIAEALAGEMKIPLYKLDASKFESKFVGESEKNLADIFNQLETKFRETGEYSILFIDEADSILSDREKSGDYKSGLVNMLLQYLNNSTERGIIVLTATNYKDKIDKAVSSRLGVPIQIDLPDAEARKSMVKLAFKDVKITENLTDTDIEEIASRMSGFSSRDIANVLSTTIDNSLAYSDKPLTVEDFKTEINNFALSHELPEINDRNKTSAYDTYLKRVKISIDDPQTLDDIGGMKEVKEKLLSVASFDEKHPDIAERYKNNKIKEQGGILLYGEPGCGKTFILKALAAHLNLPLYEFKLSEQGQTYIHGTTQNIGKIFTQLKEKYRKTGEKSILLLDEFEDIAGRRDGNNASYKQEETDALLKEIQDARRNGIIVVAATNFYDKIDDAMKRPGRFTTVYVPSPDLDSRFDIIKKSLKGREIAEVILKDDENIKELANVTDGMSIATITNAINQFVKDAIDERVEYLTTEDFKKMFIEVKNEMRNRT